MVDGAAGALEVVGVDRGERLGGGSAAAHHGRHAELFQQVRQRVVGVHGDQQHAVDAVRGQILGQPLPLAVVADEGEQQLHLGVGEGRADPADDVREVRLGEEPGLGLGHDEGDGVRAVSGECAGRAVGYVSQLGDGGFDRLTGVLADPRRAVDDP